MTFDIQNLLPQKVNLQNAAAEQIPVPQKGMLIRFCMC